MKLLIVVSAIVSICSIGKIWGSVQMEGMFVYFFGGLCFCLFLVCVGLKWTEADQFVNG